MTSKDRAIFGIPVVDAPVHGPRIKAFHVSVEMFVGMMTGGDKHYRITSDPIPDGAKIENVRVLFDHDIIEIILSHPSFEPVAPFDPIPQLATRAETIKP